jgi:hypothetical protein
MSIATLTYADTTDKITTIPIQEEPTFTVTQFPFIFDGEKRNAFRINPDLMQPRIIYPFEFLGHDWFAFKEQDDDECHFFYAPKDAPGDDD